MSKKNKAKQTPEAGEATETVEATPEVAEPTDTAEVSETAEPAEEVEEKNPQSVDESAETVETKPEKIRHAEYSLPSGLKVGDVAPETVYGEYRTGRLTTDQPQRARVIVNKGERITQGIYAQLTVK